MKASKTKANPSGEKGTLNWTSQNSKSCVIYARCSTPDQETANQISQLQEFAGKQGWKVAEVIQDICSGGKSSNERQGLRRVFDMAHKRQFDILLFWSLDRLSREGSRATIGYLEQLEQAKVDWHSYTEQYLSSMGIFKDCIISLLSALARQEKVRISERTKAGLERVKRVEGRRLGRPETDKAKVEEAVTLRGQGLTFREMAAQMGISRSRAHQLVDMAES